MGETVAHAEGEFTEREVLVHKMVAGFSIKNGRHPGPCDFFNSIGRNHTAPITKTGYGLFLKSLMPVFLSLAPGFSPVMHGDRAVLAASAASRIIAKPLKRLVRRRRFHTGLKPGARACFQNVILLQLPFISTGLQPGVESPRASQPF
jgi:hypothetical protein